MPSAASIGDLIVGGLRPTTSSSQAGTLVNNLVCATVPGAVMHGVIQNYTASARLALFLDQNGASGAVNNNLIYCRLVPASTASGPGEVTISIPFGAMGFQNGLWITLSTNLTNPFTLQQSTSADAYISMVINIA